MRFWIAYFLIQTLFLPFAALAEYKTIDELAKAYGGESCNACHSKIYGEWKASSHAHSIINSIGIMRDFIVVGLGKEWEKPISKEHLMRCMECHAPQLKEGSESLIEEVAKLIVTASDEKDEAQKAEAKKTLEKLNIHCVVCHNTKAVLEKNLKGEPKKGVYYGPSGRSSPAHGTEKSAAIQSSLFCGQCHMVYTPPDGDTVFCSSLYESYRDAYRSGGGGETCQGCHMKAKNRGHRIPGGHDIDLVREGLDLHVQAAGVKLQPGRWIPTAIIHVDLVNRAGHRTPDG